MNPRSAKDPQKKILGDEYPWMRCLRQEAFLRFEKIGFPTSGNEEWRHFPVELITEDSFKAPTERVQKNIALEIPSEIRLVFLNGFFSPEHSSLSSLPNGVRLQSLSSAFKEPQLLEKLFTFFPDKELTSFANLNEAFFEEGAVLYVPKSTVLNQPIHILYHSASNKESRTAFYPRTLIHLERNSQVQIVESFFSLGDGESLTNSLTQIRLGEDSSLEYVRLHKGEGSNYSVGQVQLIQERNSRSTSHDITLSGKLIRNDVFVALDGEGAECSLNGFYNVGGQEFVDNHTVIDHVCSHTFSREFYKGILEGNSKAVFNGRILIEKGAQKVDALQSNKNLLLSKDAVIYSKPELKIFSNDVKCKHGATVGELDHDILFYLRSRGIPMEEAKRMLLHAFAGEMIDKITLESTKEWLMRQLFSLFGWNFNES